MKSNDINLLKIDKLTVMDFDEYMQTVIDKKLLIHPYKNIWYYKSEYLFKLQETIHNYALTNKESDNMNNSINIALSSLQNEKTLDDYMRNILINNSIKSFINS